MSKLNAGKKPKTGRPRVDTEEITARVSRPLLEALSEFVASRPEPISRPAAIRAILMDWLSSHGYVSHPNDGGM